MLILKICFKFLNFNIYIEIEKNSSVNRVILDIKLILKIDLILNINHKSGSGNIFEIN